MVCRSPFAKSLLAVAAIVLTSAGWVQAASPEEVTIYRDDFGIPHIFSATAEGACFGHGYAQATDRLEELLKQYRRATGTMSEAFGPEFLQDDYRQRVWQHA
ncbi:MAG TPA: penicillin acylase family protein, partial [Pirellulales bacterium]|nr:penicillin acylase family protein [Pirellulales bacterium]